MYYDWNNLYQFNELDFECVNTVPFLHSCILFKISLKSPCGIEKKQYLCNAFGERHITNRMHIRAFSSAGSEHLPYKQRVGGSNPSTPTYLVILQIHFGRLAQLVQSICLTSRGSGVRIPQRPQKKSYKKLCDFFCVFIDDLIKLLGELNGRIETIQFLSLWILGEWEMSDFSFSDLLKFVLELITNITFPIDPFWFVSAKLMRWKKPFKKTWKALKCDPAGVRTQDPILKRDVLYQLSY